MKVFLATIILTLMSFKLQEQNAIVETLSEKEFEKIAQDFQAKYMAGSENCEEIIDAIDEHVRMSEIRFDEPAKNYTYEQLVQFCPHLPKKEVVSSITEQRLLSANMGYDYVSQLYLRKSLGDTLRETSARIWEHKNGKWKIIQMNSSINKACD